MITYRPAIPSDAPSLVSLLAEIMEYHGVCPPDVARLAKVVEEVFASQSHFFLVAEAHETIVGMCALVFSYSTWSAARVCELQDVVVAEHQRRNQIGRGLIRAAERIARERGCTRLFLLAEAWNLKAHSFYRSLGMTEKTCVYYERDLLEHLS